MSEINQLRLALQESSTARNVAEGQCISLKVGCLWQCFDDDKVSHIITVYWVFLKFSFLA